LLESRIEWEQADVLDLFAGTGALGLEAVSRGAQAVTFIEQNRKVLKFARNNAQNLEVLDRCTFLSLDAVAYLRRYRGPPFDLILADPPYAFDGMLTLPELALPLLRPGGRLVLEHGKYTPFYEHPALEVNRTYGRAYITIFRKEDTVGA